MGTSNLPAILAKESVRRREFPVVAERIFMAHAGVCPLPRRAAERLRKYADDASRDHQESGGAAAEVENCRRSAARLLDCGPGEVSLLGPTSLGLNLVANGLKWRKGDEVIYYSDDYPANVYPWSKLSALGVKTVPLTPGRPGEITWDLISSVLNGRTRLLALASCHFLSGRRIDIDTIGRAARERGILFCVDGIQSLGAFPLSVKNVDFLSADSHKWLLGPMGAGIFYVKNSSRSLLEPTLLGSWNVISPDFVARDRIDYYEGGRRYEPGALNLPGLFAMGSSMELLLETGTEAVGKRILELRDRIASGAMEAGFGIYGGEGAKDPSGGGCGNSGILSLTNGRRDIETLHRRLLAEGITLSLRRNRSGEELLRVSPHFYNTEEEVETLLRALKT